MATEITEELRKVFLDVFRRFASADGGTIRGKDVKKSLQILGMNPTEKEIADMIEEESYTDKDIPFDAFCAMMQKHYRDPKRERDELIAAFEKFDVNYDGFISHKALSDLLTQTGSERLQVAEVKGLLEDLDLDHGGVITYDEDIVNRLIVQELTQEMKDDFRKVFDLFDKDHSGNIDKSEMEGMVKALGMRPTEEQLSRMLKEVGTGDSVSFEGFCLLMRRWYREADLERDKILEAFKIYDKDGDGKISCEEFLQVLTEYDDEEEGGMGPDAAEALVREMDIDKDGFVSYEEFVVHYMNR